MFFNQVPAMHKTRAVSSELLAMEFGGLPRQGGGLIPVMETRVRDRLRAAAR